MNEPKIGNLKKTFDDCKRKKKNFETSTVLLIEKTKRNIIEKIKFDSLFKEEFTNLKCEECKYFVICNENKKKKKGTTCFEMESFYFSQCFFVEEISFFWGKDSIFNLETSHLKNIINLLYNKKKATVRHALEAPKEKRKFFYVHMNRNFTDAFYDSKKIKNLKKETLDLEINLITNIRTIIKLRESENYNFLFEKNVFLDEEELFLELKKIEENLALNEPVMI